MNAVFIALGIAALFCIVGGIEKSLHLRADPSRVMTELWLGDDPMPSCQRCLDGEHALCADLLWSERYGVHACGCTNAAHEEET